MEDAGVMKDGDESAQRDRERPTIRVAQLVEGRAVLESERADPQRRRNRRDELLHVCELAGIGRVLPRWVELDVV